MRRAIPGAILACLIPAACESGGAAGTLGNVLGGMTGSYPGTASGNAGALSRAEIDAGLRQALEIGTERVAAQIGVTDGYWGDPRIRIPLPGRLGEAQAQLSQAGLSGPLDDLQRRMNRAAEDAVPEGKTIVIDAVKSITIQDALAILQGSDTAATDYLRSRTEDSLRRTFRPHVEDALTASGAYQALDSVTSSVPMLAVAASDYKASLTDHAVRLGLDGLFAYLAVEEQKIRDNPAARTTELLRKVFGAA